MPSVGVELKRDCLADEPSFPEIEPRPAFQMVDGFVATEKDKADVPRRPQLHLSIAKQQPAIPALVALVRRREARAPEAGTQWSSPGTLADGIQYETCDQLRSNAKKRLCALAHHPNPIACSAPPFFFSQAFASSVRGQSSAHSFQNFGPWFISLRCATSCATR